MNLNEKKKVLIKAGCPVEVSGFNKDWEKILIEKYWKEYEENNK